MIKKFVLPAFVAVTVALPSHASAYTIDRQAVQDCVQEKATKWACATTDKIETVAATATSFCVQKIAPPATVSELKAEGDALDYVWTIAQQTRFLSLVMSGLKTVQSWTSQGRRDSD
jgi:hypothetical protein